MTRAKQHSLSVQRCQQHYRETGCCITCGLPLEDSPWVRCRRCHGKALEWRRAKCGYRPWQPGGYGRPPLEYHNPDTGTRHQHLVHDLANLQATTPA